MRLVLVFHLASFLKKVALRLSLYRNGSETIIVNYRPVSTHFASFFIHSDSLFLCGGVWQIGGWMVRIGGGGEYLIFGVEPGAQVYQFAALRAEW
jgi:hypothetical protein